MPTLNKVSIEFRYNIDSLYYKIVPIIHTIFLYKRTIQFLDDINEVQNIEGEGGMKNETETEVKDSHLVSNASLSAGSSNAMEGKAAKDAEWLKNVRFAIEGVTQLLVGMIGLVGKDRNIYYAYLLIFA